MEQETGFNAADSSHVFQDTTFVLADSLSDGTPPKKNEVEGSIKYKAREIETLVETQTMVLRGRAKITYQNIVLKAAKITVDWKNNLMTAEAVWDTVWVHDPETGDSTLTPQMTGIPEFSESGDVMKGEKMIYNFETRKGRVLRGRTVFEDGFYSGNTIKMVKPKTLNVSNAKFTTCDAEEPHFHFWADKMRVDVNKKVVAKPIVLYIGKVPVIALPYAYFPIRKGRQSGILIPRYGESSTEGRYLRGLGYYWAASEYWDLKSRVDYFEKSGFLFRGDLRYNVRYKLSGSISGSWTRKDFDISGTQDRRWDLAVRHNQTLSPTATLSVNGTFVNSGNFYQDLSGNREERLQQEIRSNATLTQKLGGSKSITVNLSQTRDLQTDEITETLPQVSFRVGQFPLIPQSRKGKGEEPVNRWYHNIRLSYNSNFKLQQQKTLLADSSDFDWNRDMGWDHNMSLSSPQKFFKYLSINPSLSYRETWYNKRQNYHLDESSNEILSDEEKGFFALRTYSLSVGFSTKLYGLFQPRFLGSVMLRHVVTPNVSFSFRPDFTELQYGYTQEVADSLGVIYTKDQFAGGLYRSTPSGKSRQMSLSFSNLFQMKAGEGEREKKFDLFNWSLSTSYNWEATEYKLGNLSSSISANPMRNVSLSIRSLYSPYQTDEDGNIVDKLYVEKIDWSNIGSIFGTRWLRATSINIGMNVRLSGTASSSGRSGSSKMGSESTIETESDSVAVNDLIPEEEPEDRFRMSDRVSGFDIPWNLTASVNYNENRYDPDNITKTFYINGSLDFNLTKKWKISYTARYDFVNHEMISQDFVFYRDLHCWEARFVWTPTGIYKQFYFKINVKASMLKDIKVEKGSGKRSVFSSAYY